MENRKRAPLSRTIRKQGHWTEEDARRVLGELEASGESVTGFARRRGLVPQRLWWWRKRLAERVPAVPGGVTATFIPVMVRPAEREAAAALELGGGLRVQLRTLDETSAAWVACVARALGAAS